MVLVFLNDFNKRAKDLWKAKKFAFNRTLEVNVDKKNNINWKAEHVLKDDAVPSSKVTLKQTEGGLGDLELEWGSSVCPKFTLSTKELMADSSVELCVEGSDTGNLDMEYGQEQWATKVNAKYKGANLTVEGQASVAWEKITFGCGGVLDTSDGTLSAYNCGVRLDQDADRTYVLRSQDKFNKLEVAFYNKVSKDSEIGAQVNIDMGKGKIGAELGGSYVMDGNTKLRYGVNSDANVQLAYEYKFSSNVKGFLGTKYSLTENKVTDGFGYKLVFDL